MTKMPFSKLHTSCIFVTFTRQSFGHPLCYNKCNNMIQECLQWQASKADMIASKQLAVPKAQQQQQATSSGDRNSVSASMHSWWWKLQSKKAAADTTGNTCGISKKSNSINQLVVLIAIVQWLLWPASSKLQQWSAMPMATATIDQ